MDTTTYIEENASSKKISDKQKRNLIVISVALFPLIVSTIIFVLIVLIGNIQFPEKIGTKSEFTEIILPVDKAIISKKFSISGAIKDMPSDTFIYLIENRDKQFWPKLSIGNKAKTWKKQLTAHGKKNRYFSFLLVEVDNKGKKKFDKWFETSRKTGKYPGLKHIDFAKPVTKVRVMTK